MRPLLIDTDPGVDDALAILMCQADPCVEVIALTVCGGNVGLAHTLRNALTLAERTNTPRKRLPVYPGAERAFLEPNVDAAFVHGSNGFGDAALPLPTSNPQRQHAAQAIIELAHQHAGALEILALAPLSNLALALLLEPKLPQLIKRLTVMGGALSAHGNISAFAEFNIAVDPEAAAIVFDRFPHLTLVDWEQTLAHAPTVADTERWFAGASANAGFMQRISRATLRFKRSLVPDIQDDSAIDWPWADPLAAHVALEDSAPSPNTAVDVLLAGPARGATLRNRRKAFKVAQATIDSAAFWRRIEQSLS